MAAEGVDDVAVFSLLATLAKAAAAGARSGELQPTDAASQAADTGQFACMLLMRGPVADRAATWGAGSTAGSSRGGAAAVAAPSGPLTSSAEAQASSTQPRGGAAAVMWAAAAARGVAAFASAVEGAAAALQRDSRG